MKDFTETRDATSFVDDYNVILLVFFVLFLTVVCFVHYMSFFNLAVMVGSIIVVCYLVGNRAYAMGKDTGINYTMETLIEHGFIQAEATEDDVELKVEPNVVYYDRCNNCGEGWIANPSATKRHKYNATRD